MIDHGVEIRLYPSNLGLARFLVVQHVQVVRGVPELSAIASDCKNKLIFRRLRSSLERACPWKRGHPSLQKKPRSMGAWSCCSMSAPWPVINISKQS